MRVCVALMVVAMLASSAQAQETPVQTALDAVVAQALRQAQLDLQTRRCRCGQRRRPGNDCRPDAAACTGPSATRQHGRLH